jgi:hypothetical protein
MSRLYMLPYRMSYDPAVRRVMWKAFVRVAAGSTTYIYRFVRSSPPGFRNKRTERVLFWIVLPYSLRLFFMTIARERERKRKRED